MASLWIKLDLGARGQIGPGKIALLKAIGAHRSISAAARAMGMSYRRAWMLVEAVNAALDGPAVETHVGGAGRGGAVLTARGERLIALYDKIHAEAEAAARPSLDELG
jgi:molybdate transport system regulatory protein